MISHRPSPSGSTSPRALGRHPWTRKALAVAGAGALALVAGCGGSDSTTSAGGDTPLKVGTTNTLSDATLFIAQDRGYFEDEGLDVELTPFKSGGEMVSALGTGSLDIGGGGPNAGLYNALNREINLRIVADKGQILPKKSYFSLVVRKELYDSGKITTVEDLKGKKVADYQESGTTGAALARILETGDLTIKDVNRTMLGGTEQVAAFQNGSVDAGILAEPYITVAEEEGVGKEIFPSGDAYPNQEGTVLMYGDEFAKNEEAGVAFMKAYLRAARDYTDAVEDGNLTGPGSDELIKIIAKETQLDPEQIPKMRVQSVDPNGDLNTESMQEDLDFWKENGWVDNGAASVDEAIDESFADEAEEDLGTYEKKASK